MLRLAIFVVVFSLSVCCCIVEGVLLVYGRKGIASYLDVVLQAKLAIVGQVGSGSRCGGDASRVVLKI